MFKLKRRILMATVKTGYGNAKGEVTAEHLNFYRRRNRYIGGIIAEPLYLDSGLRELPTQIGIDADDKIIGLQKLTDTIHEHGAKAIAHLNHPGRMANPKIPNNYFVSASTLPCENGGGIPEALDERGMDKAVSLFTDAAVRAEKSGFDYIEIQMGHGYLLAQFLSQKINIRTDTYGGSFENRMRFPLRVLKAVLAATHLGIIVRISADEMFQGGISIAEMIPFVQRLEQQGVSAIHVSVGSICNTPPWYFQHMFVPKGKSWALADEIRKKIRIPVIYVGQINTFKDVDSLLNKAENTYVALGRTLVADPDFCSKYYKIDTSALRPCLSCSDGCLGNVKSGKGLACTVNPEVGKNSYDPKPVSHTKKIAIIGGGIAGMTAALYLSKRGHKVSLYEEKKLGGQFNLAYLPPHKASLKKLITYLIQSINESPVVVYHKNFLSESANEFDEIVVATGAKPTKPNIRGLKSYHTSDILLKDNTPKHKNVVIIGGGLTGTEIALHLLAHNNTVYLIELTDEIAVGMEMIERKLILKTFENSTIKIFKNTRVDAVENNRVRILKDKTEAVVLENIDLVVWAAGIQSQRPEINSDKPVHFIGDAKAVGKAQDAISQAYKIALEL